MTGRCAGMLILFLSLNAVADPLREGAELLSAGEPEAAIVKVKTAFEAMEFNELSKIVRAHEILAAAYCQIREFRKAADHLHSLRMFAPQATDANVNLPPGCTLLWREQALADSLKDLQLSATPAPKGKKGTTP